MGFSWAHIIGDALSVSHFLNLWARALAGEEVYCPKTSDSQRGLRNPNPTGKEPGSIKRVDPVGDLWVAPSDSKMTTHSFNVTVKNIKTNFGANGNEFEILSGIIWRCIAQARGGGSEPVTITIIRSDPNGLKPRAVRNSQMISSVHVDFSVAEAKLEEIVKSIGKATDERSEIDEIGESDDFIVYGAKLTFVDLSEVDFYEAKIKETSPVSVYCNVQGIGDEGAVVVLPAAVEEERVVTVTLREDEMEKVKWELKKCGLIKTLINGE